MGQIQDFWGKKSGFGDLELKCIPQKAFPRFSCFQPPLFGEKFPKKELFLSFEKPDQERLRDFGLSQVFIGTRRVWHRPVPKIPRFSDCWDHPTPHPNEDPPLDLGGKKRIFHQFWDWDGFGGGILWDGIGALDLG